MSPRILSLALVFLVAAATAGLAQETPADPAATIPAATRSEADCAGFISGTPVSKDIYVLDGADNDSHSPVRQFAAGDSVFLSSRSGATFVVGIEYTVVRQAKELFRTSWYPGQHWSIRSLGTPYEDIGRVKVTHVTPAGAVAEVAFACGPMYPGDLAVPYQLRAIPEYAPSQQFDRFAPSKGNPMGAITAARNNAGYLGVGSIAYVSLGQTDGVKPGQRYRIFQIARDRSAGLFALPETPRESLGEMIILSTQEKSSVGMVVSSTREISLGDGIELE